MTMILPVDTEFPRGADDVPIEGNGFGLVEHLFQGNGCHGGRLIGDHDAEISPGHGPGRLGAEAQGQQPVERRRTAAPLQVPQRDAAGLLPRALGDPPRNQVSHAAEALNRPDAGGGLHRHLPGDGRRAFGDDDDGVLFPSGFPLPNLVARFVDVEGNLRYQNDVGVARQAGVQCDPSGVAPHQLYHHHPAMALGS
jgi:hypothetical protein